MGFGAYPAVTSAHGVFGRLLVFRNKQLTRCRKFGCGDTMARGYTMGMSSQDTISYLYCGDFPFCNYWELEYYPKPLSGTQRLLRPVSNYLNGNHDIELPVLSLSLVSQLQITKHLVDFIAVAGVCMDFFRKQLHEAAILRQLAGEQLRPYSGEIRR